MAHQDGTPPQIVSRRSFLHALAHGALTVGGTALLSACGGTTAAPSDSAAASTAPATTAPATATSMTTITVMSRRSELSEEQQQAFEASNPTIKVEFIEDDLARLFALTAAGNPPDLFRTQAPDFPQFLARNMVKDLTPYFNASSVIKPSDFAPANNYYKATSPTQIGEGQIYGMVKDWSPDFNLYAYKPAFEEAGIPLPDTATPITYEQLGQFAQQLTKIEGDRIVRWGMDLAESGNWIDRVWMNLLAEQNVKLYTDDFSKMELVNNEAARTVVQYFFDLAQVKAIPSPLNPVATWSGDDFIKGNVGIVQYGYWFSAMAESDITKGQVVFLPAPTWAGERRNPSLAATAMVMSSQSKDPDAAWAFFEWFNGGEPSVERAKSGWGVPGLVSQYPLKPQETPFQQQVQAVLTEDLRYAETPIQFNPYINGSTVPTIWKSQFEQALRGSITFDQLLQAIESETNAAIVDGQERIG